MPAPSSGVSYYLPLSDERSGFEGRREEVVGGWTASLERRLGRRLTLEASAESWSAKTKDTSTGGKLGASYDLAPGALALRAPCVARGVAHSGRGL